MSYEKGRTLTAFGFAAYTGLIALELLYNIAAHFFKVFFFDVSDICWLGRHIALAVTAWGYLKMWRVGRLTLDLFSSISVWLCLVFLFLVRFHIIEVPLRTVDEGMLTYSVKAIVVRALTKLFYIVMALRAKKISPLLSAALVGAFIHVGTRDWLYTLDIFYNMGELPMVLLAIVVAALDVLAPALCFYTAKNDPNIP